jgi:hypothetical protein
VKYCPKCETTKSTDDFGPRSRSKDGLQSWCKECFVEYNRRRYADNRDTELARSKRYQAANREKVAACNRRYRVKNRERDAEYQSQWQKKYRDSQHGGTYKLTCMPTGDVYFGSAVNLQKRRHNHFKMLRDGDHSNPIMRELSKTHPPEDFEFRTMVICDREEAFYYEQKMIERVTCCNVVDVSGVPL